MKTFLRLVFFLTLLLILNFPLPFGKAENLPSPTDSPWFLPIELNDNNTKISFEVDSTWHRIHGKTSGIHGRLWLEESNDPGSIRGTISIPVGQFDTNNSSRDSRLREVMKAEKFSEVTFSLNSVENICSPQSLIGDDSCLGNATGSLSIEDHKELVPVNFSVSRSPTGFVIIGTAIFSWRSYPIVDPSILIAKLDDQVTISFTVNTISRLSTSNPINKN